MPRMLDGCSSSTALSVANTNGMAAMLHPPNSRAVTSLALVALDKCSETAGATMNQSQLYYIS